MKKILATIAAVLLLAACGKSADEAYVEFVKESTEAVRKAGNEEQLRAAMAEFEKKNAAFTQEHGDEIEKWENDPEKKKKVMTALEDMSIVFFKKSLELAGVSEDSVRAGGRLIGLPGDSVR